MLNTAGGDGGLKELIHEYEICLHTRLQDTYYSIKVWDKQNIKKLEQTALISFRKLDKTNLDQPR